jgi:arylformamidase
MRHIIDLSHDIEHGMITYPGLPAPRVRDHLSFEASRSHYGEGTEFHIGAIDMVANTGTYLDVPAHRYSDGYGLAELPLERVLDVPVAVIDASGHIAIPCDVLEGHRLSGRAVLFRTGWDRHWRTERYGAGGHPHLSTPLAEALVRARPALVGIDSLNVDSTDGHDRPVHSGLLAAGIPIIEHLAGLERLPADRDVRLTALPVAVRGLGSFPVRAVAHWHGA